MGKTGRGALSSSTGPGDHPPPMRVGTGKVWQGRGVRRPISIPGLQTLWDQTTVRWLRWSEGWRAITAPPGSVYSGDLDALRPCQLPTTFRWLASLRLGNGSKERITLEFLDQYLYRPGTSRAGKSCGVSAVCPLAHP